MIGLCTLHNQYNCFINNFWSNLTLGVKSQFEKVAKECEKMKKENEKLKTELKGLDFVSILYTYMYSS